LNWIPFRVCVHLPRLSGPLETGTDLPLRFDALQRHPRPGPLVERAVQPRPGAALGFSQPLSGFSVNRVPRPCFMPQPFLDCPPSELSPREDREALSGSLAPLQLSTVLQDASSAILSPEVSPTPALLAQSPGSPTNYGSPFGGSEGPLPGRPGSQTAGSSLPSASPASKLSSLHESVRTGLSKLKP